MLHAVQDAGGGFNTIPDGEVAEIAGYLGISLAEIDGVLSYYHMFSRKKRGRYVIRLCDSLSCRVTASLDIYDYLRRSLGIRKDETTRDGMFSLEIVNCLGSCNTAPNMMINNKLYSSLTVSRVEEILEVLAAGGKI
jgi:NADH:ubiquinone oxidoreductase subunit E